MIRQVVLDHKWFYHYRVHSRKAEDLCPGEFGPLRHYLDEMLQTCPSEPFLTGPRSSALRIPCGVTPTLIKNHPIIDLCAHGIQTNTNHKS
ncbi:MAG: hypothetical protein ABIH41_03905, partial [Nanoarchaeota archaeon]